MIQFICYTPEQQERLFSVLEKHRLFCTLTDNPTRFNVENLSAEALLDLIVETDITFMSEGSIILARFAF